MNLLKSILTFFRLPYSFKFTRAGIIYMVIILVLAFSAFNSGNNLLYLILAMLLSAFIISGILSKITLDNIKIEMVLPEHIYAEKEFFEVLKVKNSKKFFSSYSLYIHYDTKKIYIPKLAPSQVVNYTLKNVFNKRGIYKTRNFYSVTTYPFSLVEKKEKIDYSTEFIVYPKIIDIKKIVDMFTITLSASHKKDDIEEFYSFREYQIGDKAKEISWRRTAKDNKLMSKKYKTSEINKFCIIININTHNEEKIEEGISIAASLVKYLLKKGGYVKLITENGIIPYGNDISHLYRILRFLAVYTPTNEKKMIKITDEKIIYIEVGEEEVKIKVSN